MVLEKFFLKKRCFGEWEIETILIKIPRYLQKNPIKIIFGPDILDIMLLKAHSFCSRKRF